MKNFFRVLLTGIFLMAFSGFARAAEGGSKSPALAWGLSFFLPAGGQYYDGDIGGGVFFDLGIGLCLLGAQLEADSQTNFYNLKTPAQPGQIPPPAQPESYGTFAAIFTTGAFGFWLVSWIDAPGTANAYNAKNGKERDSWNFQLAPIKSPSTPQEFPGLQMAYRF